MHRHPVNNTSRSAFNPFSPQGANVVHFRQDLTHEAVVVDVIVNDSHPEYAQDGYNIGAVQFRALKTDAYREQGQLNWALPLDANISEYPLKHEIVQVVSMLNRLYYTRKLNVSTRVTSHAFFGLNEELAPVSKQNDAIIGNAGSAHTPKKEGLTKKNELGKTFQDQDRVFRLRHDEGDMILEGRSGHSIRFGAAWKKNTNFQSVGIDQAPNLLFRVGVDPRATPSVDSPFGLVKEDINEDSTSLYLVSDQIIPLRFATEKASVHRASIKDFPKRLDGSQIVMNTDRLVLNARKDKILGFALHGVHWTSGRDFSVDADRDSLSKVGHIYDLTAGKSAAIVAPKVYLGLHAGEEEPVPVGAQLAAFLEQFLNIFITNAPTAVFPTSSPGKPSPLNPAITQALTKLKQDVAKGAHASFNSQVVFTTKE